MFSYLKAKYVAQGAARNQNCKVVVSASDRKLNLRSGYCMCGPAAMCEKTVNKFKFVDCD